MADFVAVLKKTLDGLNDPTPELRQRVYDKARATISAKLAAITPPPPKAVAERQKRALEDAIATVEQQYPDRPGPKISPDPLAELDDVFASIERQKKDPPKKADAESIDPVPPAAEPAAEPEPEPESPPPPEVESLPEPKAESWPKTTPVVAPPPPAPDAPDDDVLPAPSQGFGHEPGYEPQQDNDPFASAEDEREHTYQRKRGYGLIAALVAIAALAAGGYGIWLNKEALFGPNAPAPVAAAPEQPASPQQPADEPATETAALPPAEEEPAPVAEEPATPQKFTQRLTPEGKEIDAGPAGGATSLGEGTSLAAVTQPPAGSTSPQPQEAPSASEPSVAVGQRAIFYEERTNVAQGSAEPGSIVWSLVQESPGGDLPPEPAIRAEATIPGKDVQLRMTIRRNADQTLPASHIIEVIFLTPEGFEGGGIENILRVSMKGSEQEAGSPLIGIPAKIADGFFLIALNDGKAEIDANMTLLRRQSWIDVPVIYKSGRRALFTMEKGIPGQKAFEEAIKAWQEAASAEGEGNG
ncbi:hypothetical protein EET67_06965 [Pseudaminobacter arsenicus]|uniref:Uncharacterized protein n=1 Tax=Borborobacter arsenicus TaxID=1851146 RepID=A0A432V884_9HYPH|nr:hypothetical protein [Pseudaminobacter arsenicus]RUM98374.1 hypothetical protein EET67_06965 [Pseudaminobacter arsenicus]